MNRRFGATLVEVLVTIFIMGIGLLSLLTLFPIGALSMAQAIKDSRSAQASANGMGIATSRNLRHDLQIVNPSRPAPLPPLNLYEQPVRTVYPPPTPLHATDSPPTPSDGPSYPVYVDPIGVRLYSANSLLANWLGGEALPARNLGIPRVSPQFIVSQPLPGNQIIATLNSFSLLDDITFGPDGVPIDSNGKTFGQPGFSGVQREGRYTWGLLFKRPKTSTPSVVDLTVVVYSGRPLQLLTGAGGLGGENTYTATGQERQNSLIVTWTASQERPNIKKGSWILDGTAYDTRVPGTAFSSNVLKYGPVHGYFYRVANIVSESANQMELELTTPLKAPIGVPPVAAGYHPRIIVMDNVAEVFEKGPGWLP